jgi:hypothetical protein
MPEYIVRELDIHEKDINNNIISFLEEAFGKDIDLKKIIRNTYTRNGKTLYLGAFHNERLVAFNCFMAFEFQFNNKTVYAHQSCWAGTSPQYRKKGLFSLLYDEAKRILLNRGSAFIWGAGNSQSQPILINKLGFRKIEMVKVEIPAAFGGKFFIDHYLKKLTQGAGVKVKDAFLPNEAEVMELKVGEFGEEVKIYDRYNNILWGKIKHKEKFGLKLKYLAVGGMVVNKPHLLHILFKEIAAKEKVDYFQIVANKTNTYLHNFLHVRPAANTEALVIYDLAMDTTIANFNFFIGIKDVF